MKWWSVVNTSVSVWFSYVSESDDFRMIFAARLLDNALKKIHMFLIFQWDSHASTFFSLLVILLTLNKSYFLLCSWVTIAPLRVCFIVSLTLTSCLRWLEAWTKVLKVVSWLASFLSDFCNAFLLFHLLVLSH